MSVNKLKLEELESSTITVVYTLDKNIDERIICEFIPIEYILVNNKPLYISKKEKIPLKIINEIYNDNIIIGIYSGKIRRGIRKDMPMDNMVSCDIVYEKKSFHLKLSKDTITVLGCSSIEKGREVSIFMLKKINDLKNIIEKFQRENNYDIQRKKFIEGFKNNEIIKDSKLSTLFECYSLDFTNEEYNILDEKLIKFKILQPIFKGNINIIEENISNSVYNFKLDKEKDELTLYLFAIFLSDKVPLKYIPWNMQQINIAIPLQKNNIKNDKKLYKFRINIPINNSCKIFSPLSREETYKYYLFLVNLYEQFLYYEKNLLEKIKNSENKLDIIEDEIFDKFIF